MPGPSSAATFERPAVATDHAQEFPLKTFPRQIHAPNSPRFENPFRVFGSKYSNLIDIDELEATMSDHRITMIVRGMHRPSGVPSLVGLLPARRISVLSKAQRPAKPASAA